MKTLICTLLCALMIPPNFVQLSPMKKWTASDLRAEIEPEIPGLPKPRLLTQEGRPVGVYYNGKVYPLEEKPEPEPTLRPSSPRAPSPQPPPQTRWTPLMLPQHVLQCLRSFPRFLRRNFYRYNTRNPGFPDDCQLKRDGSTIAKAMNGRMFDFDGRPIEHFHIGDLLTYQDNAFAIYIGDRFDIVDEEFRHLILF